MTLGLKNGVLDIILHRLRKIQIRILVDQALDRITLSRLGKYFSYEHYYLFAYGYSAINYTSRRSNIRMREAVKEDIPGLIKMLPERGKEYEKRMDRGDIAIVAVYNNDIVGMEWLSRMHQYSIDNTYSVRLAEHERWSYDTYIAPRFRSSAIWLNMNNEILRYARDHSIKIILGMVKAINQLSLRTCMKFGLHVREEVVFARVFAMRLHFIWHYDLQGCHSYAGMRIRMDAAKHYSSWAIK